jgi:hypothetical protein
VDFGAGHVEDVAAHGPQGLATMPLYASPSSNDLGTKPMMGATSDRLTALTWERAGSGVRVVQVLATDLVRYSYVHPPAERPLVEDFTSMPSTSTFPTSLQVEIVEARRLLTLDIQSKIHERRAPMARVKRALETDNHTFGELVSWLREVGGVCRQAPHHATSLLTIW